MDEGDSAEGLRGDDETGRMGRWVLGFRGKLVFDTCSLSHAVEDWEKAVRDACKGARSLSECFARLERRIGSAALTRLLLAQCSVNECYIPESVWRELKVYGFDARLGAAIAELRRFLRSKIRVIPDPPKEVIDEVMQEARRAGLDINEEDAAVVAAARITGAAVVTADANLAEVAARMGVPVLKTIDGALTIRRYAEEERGKRTRREWERRRFLRPAPERFTW